MGLFNFSDGTFFEPVDILEHLGGILGSVEIAISLIILLIAVIVWRHDKTGYALST